MCNLLLLSLTLLLDKWKKQARKKKKRKYEIYDGIYRKPTVPSLSSETKNELKDTNEISVRLSSENTQKTEVKIYILTGKIYL